MKLHIGCGKNYIPGWINCDIIEKYDKYLDARKTFPFEDASIDFILNEHFIEHISYIDARRFLIECYRILKFNGVIKISTPDLGYLVDRYKDNNFPSYADVGIKTKSRCMIINKTFRDWGHQFIYDAEILKEQLINAGFNKIIQIFDKNIIHNEEFKGLLSRPYHHELIFEATK
jgi:predicted SAM-dependent methyltransferase